MKQLSESIFRMRAEGSMKQLSESIFRMRDSAKVICLTHPTLYLSHPTIESFIWNTLIRAAHNLKSSTQSTLLSDPPISIFHRMRLHGVQPDSHTFPFLLQSFTSSAHLIYGQKAHAQSIRFGLNRDAFVQTSLINMYSCCGELSSAHQMFDEIAQPDLPTWNSIINANVQVGSLDVARKLFDRMHERNVTSWSCMIHGYVKWGEYREALTLFREMLVFEKDGLEPNGFTMSSVLSACSALGALEQGKWAHACISRYRIEVTVVLGTALIDMYAKCGSIETASWVFENLGSNKDVMAWSAMISGLAMHGNGEECIKLFYKMMDDGIRPNDVTLLGVLSGCVHCGFVNEGKKLFKWMNNEFGFRPLIQHYGCMVDLYARAGLIDDAMEIIRSMPMKPDVLIWGALLSGARKTQDIKTCEMALRKLIELDPTNAGAYVLVSNVYAKMEMWKDVRHVRDLMDLKGIKKVPGCSTVEFGGIFHEFYSGDDSHPETREIYAKIEDIMSRLRMEGFVGSKEETLLDLDEEAKETSLSHHSERLAVAFALLKTCPGATVRVIKNLRTCVDCHEAMKMISRVFDRDIIIRDCTRFHHFRSGACSCKDYW